MNKCSSRSHRWAWPAAGWCTAAGAAASPAYCFLCWRRLSCSPPVSTHIHPHSPRSPCCRCSVFTAVVEAHQTQRDSGCTTVRFAMLNLIDLAGGSHGAGGLGLGVACRHSTCGQHSCLGLIAHGILCVIPALTLAHLCAGSERVSKSGATGEQLTEAKKINQSLTTLGRVVSAHQRGGRSLPPAPLSPSVNCPLMGHHQPALGQAFFASLSSHHLPLFLPPVLATSGR